MLCSIFKNWDAPRPIDIEAFCKKHDALTPEVAKWISDYRHYLDTGEIRRREKFA
jgi:hypothetical protein